MTYAVYLKQDVDKYNWIEKRADLILKNVCDYDMDEIIENQPDLILIYAGHNEFYGALGVASAESIDKIRWIVKIYLQLNHFKTFILIKNMIGKIFIIFFISSLVSALNSLRAHPKEEARILFLFPSN